MARDTRAKSAPYTVGYCKPPVGRRFLPGQSGNPRGRPRAAQAEEPPVAGLDPLLAATMRVMAEHVRVRVNGRDIAVSGEEAVVRALLDRAHFGDIKAARQLMALRDEAREQLARVEASVRQTEGNCAAKGALMIAEVLRARARLAPEELEAELVRIARATVASLDTEAREAEVEARKIVARADARRADKMMAARPETAPGPVEEARLGRREGCGGLRAAADTRAAIDVPVAPPPAPRDRQSFDTPPRRRGSDEPLIPNTQPLAARDYY